MDYSVGGVYLLGEVTFLPKAGYSGVVTIPYVGTDADGIEYTGTVQVMVYFSYDLSTPSFPT